MLFSAACNFFIISTKRSLKVSTSVAVIIVNVYNSKTLCAVFFAILLYNWHIVQFCSESQPTNPCSLHKCILLLARVSNVNCQIILYLIRTILCAITHKSCAVVRIINSRYPRFSCGCGRFFNMFKNSIANRHKVVSFAFSEFRLNFERLTFIIIYFI